MATQYERDAADTKVTVSHRLDAEIVRRLDEWAKAEGVTRSAVIERLCERQFRAARLVGPVSTLKQVMGSIQPLAGDPIVEWLLCGPPEFERAAKRAQKGSAS